MSSVGLLSLKPETYVKVSNLFSEYEVPLLGVLAQFYLLLVRWREDGRGTR